LKMQDRMEACIDSLTDSVRYYFLCKPCVNRVEFSGTGEKPRASAFRVV
jgi:hypothetical protein